MKTILLGWGLCLMGAAFFAYSQGEIKAEDDGGQDAGQDLAHDHQLKAVDVVDKVVDNRDLRKVVLLLALSLL